MSAQVLSSPAGQRGTLVWAMSQSSSANSANLVLRFKGGVWEESALAQIQGPKAVAWRDMLWLLMTGAGVLLLVCAALSV